MKTATFTLAVILLLAASTCFAEDAHFISATANLQSNGFLDVAWKEAGLGNNETAWFAAIADATAVYACMNNGGNHPQAANKATVNGPVSASGSFTSGKNGNIVGELTVAPPGPGAFSYPPGQFMVLASVQYLNVTIMDITFEDAQSIPGVFSLTLVTVPGL